MTATRLRGSRSIPWVLSALAVAVLIASLACVGAAFTYVFGWWASGVAVLVVVGVVALAIRTFPLASSPRHR